ncbi:MAG: hypothetical protein EZS26_002158 [Candidatus Ordinivivax streblomastigis]|jgi:hypothetical protein|uniref:N-acetyltransferase domain-containing protein n=1 Tax=Candidatus Ordinivivax streblomastigis TaxID=2540710 RepID=A0A5M8NZU8_9BACT|nr:MAG: hypothetical protein EZS26_002158 [Candidatus Ordinivivax streblomastigis]MDR2844296.1 hypothetical protein [Candidatus Symbiothrix sp.]
MKILKVQGSDPILYGLIGPLVMNPAVLASNDNYPFKNSNEHVWYIAVNHNKEVKGFLSVLNNKIGNDYTNKDMDLQGLLIEKALEEIPNGRIVSFIAVKEEWPLMEKLGFAMYKEGVKYSKMIKKL